MHRQVVSLGVLSCLFQLAELMIAPLCCEFSEHAVCLLSLCTKRCQQHRGHPQCSPSEKCCLHAIRLVNYFLYMNLYLPNVRRETFNSRSNVKMQDSGANTPTPQG